MTIMRLESWTMTCRVCRCTLMFCASGEKCSIVHDYVWMLLERNDFDMIAGTRVDSLLVFIPPPSSVT
jgi:hypothetical protein